MEQRSYTLCVKMKKADKVTENGLKESINQLAEKLSIPEKNVSLNTIFIMWDTDPGAETVAAGVFIAAVVILFSIVVIYNIFYVGMYRKYRNTGNCRAIGMTKKQNEQMIFREGMYCPASVYLLELIVGYFGTDLFFTKIAGFSSVNESINEAIANTQLFSIPVLAGAGILSLITVCLSRETADADCSQSVSGGSGAVSGKHREKETEEERMQAGKADRSYQGKFVKQPETDIDDHPYYGAELCNVRHHR